MAELTLHVRAGNATAQEVQSALGEILAALDDPASEEARAAAAAGIDGAALGREVEVSEPAAGFDGGLLLIIALKAAASGAGSALAKKAWDQLLGPAIKRRRGLDAVGARQEPSDADSTDDGDAGAQPG